MLQLKNVEISCAKERWFRSSIWSSILQNINLSVHFGELVALVGGSGEGKSLLLQNILGLLPSSMRSSGQILINNQIINSGQQHQLRGNTLGYIPQSVSALNPLLKVGKQIQRATSLSGLPQCESAIVEQLSHYNLSEKLLDQYPLSLSGGMAKRILVSCATMSQAKFILADEVTAWLDLHHAEILLNHMKALCYQGRGVLWITHDLHLAAKFADRIAVLHQGTIKNVVSAAELRCGGGGQWLQSLWQALPEHRFIHAGESLHAASA